MPIVEDKPMTRGRSLLTAAQYVGKGSLIGRGICRTTGGHNWAPILFLVREHLGTGTPPPDAYPEDKTYEVRRCRRCGILDREQVAQLVVELDPKLAEEVAVWAKA